MNYESLKIWLLTALEEIQSGISEGYKKTFVDRSRVYENMMNNIIESSPEPLAILDIRHIKEKKYFFEKCLLIERKLLAAPLLIYERRTPMTNAAATFNFPIISSPPWSGKASLLPLFFFSSPVFQDSSLFIIESNSLSAEFLASKVRKELINIAQVSGCTNPKSFSNCSESSLMYFDEKTFLAVLLKESLVDIPFPNTKIIILDDTYEYSRTTEVILCMLLRMIRYKQPNLRIIFIPGTDYIIPLKSYLENFSQKGLNFRSGVFTEPQLYLSVYLFTFAQSLDSLKEFVFTKGNYDLKDTCREIEKVLVEKDSKKIMVFVSSYDEAFEMKFVLISQNKNLNVFIINKCTESNFFDYLFERLQPDEKMVIISTNRFERAIGIPDVTHIIDTGKELTLELEGIDVIKTTKKNISFASAIERRWKQDNEDHLTCILLYSEKEQSSFIPIRSPKINSETLDYIFYC